MKVKAKAVPLVRLGLSMYGCWGKIDVLGTAGTGKAKGGEPLT
jgi:hypothetical protein